MALFTNQLTKFLETYQLYRTLKDWLLWAVSSQLQHTTNSPFFLHAQISTGCAHPDREIWSWPWAVLLGPGLNSKLLCPKFKLPSGLRSTTCTAQGPDAPTPSHSTPCGCLLGLLFYLERKSQTWEAWGKHIEMGAALLFPTPPLSSMQKAHRSKRALPASNPALRWRDG